MVATQMIGNGDRGNAVRSMQGALIAQGYSCGSYGADGICGAATVAAIPALVRRLMVWRAVASVTRYMGRAAR